MEAGQRLKYLFVISSTLTEDTMTVSDMLNSLTVAQSNRLPPAETGS